MKAYEVAAEIVGVAASTVRDWVKEYEVMEYVVLESKRGRHTKTACPILNDMEFREEFKNYVRKSSCEKGIEHIGEPSRSLVVLVLLVTWVIRIPYPLNSANNP